MNPDPTWQFAGIEVVSQSSGWQVTLPYWPFICLTAIAPLLWFRRSRVARYRNEHHLCAACGYDLRASTERCPECGTPFEPGEIPWPIQNAGTTRRRLFATLALLSLALSIGTAGIWALSARHVLSASFGFVGRPFDLMTEPGRIIFSTNSGNFMRWGWECERIDDDSSAGAAQTLQRGMQSPEVEGDWPDCQASLPAGWIMLATLLPPGMHTIARWRARRREAPRPADMALP